jgi:hypothetical protein
MKRARRQQRPRGSPATAGRLRALEEWMLTNFPAVREGYDNPGPAMRAGRRLGLLRRLNERLVELEARTEKLGTVTSIAMYFDDATTLRRLVKSQLRAATLSPDDRAALRRVFAELCRGGDRPKHMPIVGGRLRRSE